MAHQIRPSKAALLEECKRIRREISQIREDQKADDFHNESHATRLEALEFAVQELEDHLTA